MVSTQISLFLDANVLVAASIAKSLLETASSKKIGSSLKFIFSCLDHQLTVKVSQQVLEEAARNIKIRNQEAVTHYEKILKILAGNLKFIIVDNPTLEEIKFAIPLTHKNDVPILAAAIKSRPDYLITWNRNHFINPKVKAACDFECMTPDIFMKKVLRIKPKTKSGGKKERISP